VPPASVWLAVAVYDPTDPSAPDAAVLLIRLPQFSDVLNETGGGPNGTNPVYPPSASPTMLNPAGVSSTVRGVQLGGWNRYWNGTGVPVASH